MSEEKSDQPNNTGIQNQRTLGLSKLPDDNSPALTEIINRSLIHIQTSKALAEPVRRAGEEQEFEIAPGVTIVMCWIPAGSFLMGSPEDELGHCYSEIQHQVTIIHGFWLGKYQVTQAQWETVMGSNHSQFKGANLPVEGVSWCDISESSGFMAKVNSLAGAGEIFFLPTVAQWEYACRAGTTTALNSGKDLTIEEGRCPNLDDIAWYSENSGSRTHPVGQKKANGWGLHDMHGNVCEWCADWSGPFTDKPLVNPQGPSSGWLRVLRGGSWRSAAFRCRAAFEYTDVPSGYFGSGFRIARSAASSSVSCRNERSEAVGQAANAIQVHISKTLNRLHRIGDHELCWPDYQLVCFWAEQSNMPPAALLKILLEYKTDFQISRSMESKTSLRDGRFVNLFIDPKLNKITCLPQIKNLQIKILFVAQLGLFDLNLSAVPHLTALYCFENYLTEIDLSKVPNLKFLACHKNQLNNLVLSPVADLMGLTCFDNYITELDLSTTPKITLITCGGNRLTDLDLKQVPYLTVLGCDKNYLTSINLAHVPNLKDLRCENNLLTYLDLHTTPNLMVLVCAGNQLTNLDLSCVPNLKELWCRFNQVSELDIRPLHRLEFLKCDSIRLIQRPGQNFK